jgi:hypothetical protein
MKFPKRVGVYILAGAIACLSASPPANAAREAAPPPAIAPADGQHDFDFNIGVWKTQGNECPPLRESLPVPGRA